MLSTGTNTVAADAAVLRPRTDPTASARVAPTAVSLLIFIVEALLAEGNPADDTPERAVRRLPQGTAIGAVIVALGYSDRASTEEYRFTPIYGASRSAMFT